MPEHNKKIVIAGAGSVGCYIGGMLASNNDNVHFLARKRISKDVKKHGLHLSDWTGKRVLLAPKLISIATDENILKDADIILVCVKSKDTAAMAETIKASGNETATVFSCQNGVSNVKVLQSVLPAHTVLPVMVPYNVVYQGGGRFHCGTEGNLFCQAHELSHPLQESADNAKLGFELKPDMKSILWGKLLLNLNNPVNALSGIPLKQQLENKAYRGIYAQSLKEGLAVLRKAKIKPGKVAAVPVGVIPFILSLPNFLFKRIAQKMLAMDPQARSSMWEDLQNQRPVEVDYITGEIIKLGKQLGIPTPINEKLSRLVKEAERSGQGSPNIPAASLAL